MSASSEPSPELSERLAVFLQTADRKVLVAKLAITTGNECSANVRIDATREEDAEKIRLLLEGVDVGLKEPLAETREEAIRKFRGHLVEVLKAAGYGVDDISAGDFQINFEFDLSSGIRFATHHRLHEFDAGADDSIAKNVFQALAGIMEKMPNDVAGEVERSVASGDIDATIAAVREGDALGVFTLRPTKKLFDVLFGLDITLFGSADRQFIHERRLCVAHLLGRWDLAGDEAEALLRNWAGEYDEQQRSDLEMQIANAAMQKGHRETALLIWRKLLRFPEKLGPGNRGWAWSNIALASSPDSAERRHAAKCSADAFLEAGEKEQASKSLMILANALLFDEPTQALKTIEEIVSLIEENGLHNRALRAATHHARGNRLLQMGRYADGASDAAKAVEGLRGLIGAEDQLISSLHLAAMAHERMGGRGAAETFRSEADKLTDQAGSSHFALARRVRALLDDFDADAASKLLSEAEQHGNQEIIAAIAVIRATCDAELSDVQRLSVLEDALLRLDMSRSRDSAKRPVHLALATLLEKFGQPERAEIWYQRLLSANLFDSNACEALVQSLWRREKWGDAALVLKRQLDLRGPMPGLLYAYGRSLCEAGDFSGAVSALTHVLKLAKNDENLARLASELREQAFEKGGTIQPIPMERASQAAVTREEFESSLDEFARFISADKRMKFWVKKEGEQSWVEHPEKRAQDLLHTFLKARFLERVGLFEELDSGAGRLDLYVQLFGGLNLILELKMCGFGYSSNYAAAGETQILHYMQNRDSKLGYLIVFDARLTMYGQELLKGADSLTLFSKFIDMRPRVSAR